MLAANAGAQRRHTTTVGNAKPLWKQQGNCSQPFWPSQQPVAQRSFMSLDACWRRPPASSWPSQPGMHVAFTFAFTGAEADWDPR